MQNTAKPNVILTPVGIALLKYFRSKSGIEKEAVDEDDICQWVIENYKKEAVGRVSPELKTLMKLTEKGYLNPKIDVVRLLWTDTNESRLCALTLEYLLAHYIPDVRVEKAPIPGALKGKFGNKEMQQLFKGLFLEVERYRKENKFSVILNFTPGYKTIMAYGILVSIITGVRICYVYETSDELSFLPRIPIHVDKGWLNEFCQFLQDIETVSQERYDEFIMKASDNSEKLSLINEYIYKTENHIELTDSGKQFLDFEIPSYLFLKN